MQLKSEPVVEKPVKLVFAGGFLGAGKTTALAALAKKVIERGMRVGIITNDQSENLVDTVIVRQMLSHLGVPVEEVVEGCFCCKFDDLLRRVEKILTYGPDILMGEPVGSCTDFVAAVANPIKIRYKNAFRFAPFSVLVDPERVRDFLLEERRTSFPEEVSYLFKKQIEEADIIVLNKVDLLTENEKQQLLGVLEKHFPEKQIEAVSAREDLGLNHWLEALLSGKPGANTVLSQIDYDRYATAEAILGWLNAAVKLSSKTPFDPKTILETLALKLKEAFGANNAEIGHLKFVITSAGDAVWANLTHTSTQPAIGGQQTGAFSTATLLINARVKITPEALESIVRNCVSDISRESGMRYEILDLQCFSPAYPEPPYLMRDTAE